MYKQDPRNFKPELNLEPKRISSVIKQGTTFNTLVIMLDTEVRYSYDIEQVFNVVSMIPTSKK